MPSILLMNLRNSRDKNGVAKEMMKLGRSKHCAAQFVDSIEQQLKYQTTKL